MNIACSMEIPARMSIGHSQPLIHPALDRLLASGIDYSTTDAICKDMEFAGEIKPPGSSITLLGEPGKMKLVAWHAQETHMVRWSEMRFVATPSLRRQGIETLSDFVRAKWHWLSSLEREYLRDLYDPQKTLTDRIEAGQYASFLHWIRTRQTLNMSADDIVNGRMYTERRRTVVPADFQEFAARFLHEMIATAQSLVSPEGQCMEQSETVDPTFVTPSTSPLTRASHRSGTNWGFHKALRSHIFGAGGIDAVCTNIQERNPPEQLACKTQLSCKSEPIVEGRIGFQDVAACPDTGARYNFVSYEFAIRNRLKIDRTRSEPVKNAIGAIKQTIGVVDLSFTFKDERTKHWLEFHVLPRCPKDVVLGSMFLKLTETLTRHAHRIAYRLRSILATRLFYCGFTEERVAGWLNGDEVHALPDTGSDLMLLSADYARRQQLTIDTSLRHRKRIEFADGSWAYTVGIASDLDWRYDSDTSFTRDFYILEDLQCDVVLSYEFLFETEAFDLHEANFFDLAPDMSSSDMTFSIMIEGRSLYDRWNDLKDFLRARRHNSSTDERDEQHNIARQEALAKYKRAYNAARTLQCEERDRILSEHREQYQRMLHDISEAEQLAKAPSRQGMDAVGRTSININQITSAR